MKNTSKWKTKTNSNAIKRNIQKTKNKILGVISTKAEKLKDYIEVISQKVGQKDQEMEDVKKDKNTRKPVEEDQSPKWKFFKGK